MLDRIAVEFFRADVGEALEPIAMVEVVDTTGAVATELMEVTELLLRKRPE